MPPLFNFRLNGTIVPMIFINRERINGKLTGRRHVPVWIDGVGRFAIDEDEHLREMSFPKHLLKYRNETEWGKSSQADRRTMKNEGWQRVTPDELVGALVSAGVIRWE
jgi:hypothetical protein